MKKLSTIRWRNFRIGDWFSVSRPAPRRQNDYQAGGVGFVASGCFNNGIQAYLEPNNSSDIDDGQCITISPVDGYAFWQEDDFLGRGGAGSSIIIVRNKALNKYSGMFVASVLRRAFSCWKYATMGNKDIVNDSIVLFPATANGEPDFAYMENYMVEIEERAKLTVDLLTKPSESGIRIDASTWKQFHLYDDNLFDIDSGTKLDRVKMSNYNPSVNFIGRANANNGVTDFIDTIPGLKPYDAGLMTISLGGEYLGSCFVQDKPFYTSQNVNVLIPKHPMSDACKRFIATVIFREAQLHYKAFSDELNRHMKRDFSIPLPAKSDGAPDFAYMESYIMAVQKRMATTFSALQAI